MKKEKDSSKNRYKMTSCRDKRSIVRSLNTFSNQYENIICKQEEIDLNIKPMTLLYEDETQSDNIIFNKSDANIDMKNTDLILNAIDNLISINRKIDLKEKLKDAVKARSFNETNGFLTDEGISISQIEQIVNNEKFAKRLFNQIKNRVIFYRAGIYSTNDEVTTVKNKIKIQHTNLGNISKKEFDFTISNLWLFDADIIARVEEVNSAVSTDTRNKYFNPDYVPNSCNSSYFHPIDEEAYNDEDATYESRRNAMTEAMIHREDYGMYDEDIYKDYNTYVSTYEYDIQQVEEYIENFLNIYEEDKDNVIKISNKIKEILEVSDLEGYDMFLEYLNLDNKDEIIKAKQELLQYFPEFNLLNKFFTMKFLMDNIKEYKNKFSNILARDEKIDMEVPLEICEDIDISYKKYIEFIDLQNFMVNNCGVNNLKELRKIGDYMLVEIDNRYRLNVSENEIRFIVRKFDMYNDRYKSFYNKYSIEQKHNKYFSLIGDEQFKLAELLAKEKLTNDFLLSPTESSLNELVIHKSNYEKLAIKEIELYDKMILEPDNKTLNDEFESIQNNISGIEYNSLPEHYHPF